MKISVKKIKSEAGLLSILEQVNATGNAWSATSLIIKEEESGHEWVSFGGFNGTPTDLWLKKKGTNGQTRKTFIRASISSYAYMLSDLKSWGIEPSADFLILVKNESNKIEEKYNNDLKILNDFNDLERAAKWINNNAGNSHSRRTRWGNRATRMGLDRSFNNQLRDRCIELLKKETV